MQRGILLNIKTDIYCNANLCYRFAVLHVEDPRLGEDAAVEGPQARVCPAFCLVSVLLFYTIRWPFLLNGYIFSDKLYK